MGTRTDCETAEWQENAGLNIPSPTIQELWSKLQDTCFEVIKIAELEKSGIRDGDSCWHGSDVVGHTLSDLHNVCASLWLAYYKPTEHAEPIKAPDGDNKQERPPWASDYLPL
jgi:hypothetical protein